MEKNRFYMYLEYEVFFDGMDDHELASLIRAIYANEKGEEVTGLSPKVDMAFRMIKNRLDNNREEYEKTCLARSNAGRAGGEAKASKRKQTVANVANASKASKSQQTVANVADKDNENDKDKDNENDNEHDNEQINKTLSFSKENDCRTASVQRVIEEWNFLSEYGVKPVKTISKDSTRYKMLCKRIADNGEGGVLDAINRIRGSDFLLGRKTDFLITFDWFVKPNNFAKVADGNYDNKAALDERERFLDKWRDV